MTSVGELASHGHELKKNVPYGLPYNNTTGNKLSSTGDGAMFSESYSPFSIENTGSNQKHNTVQAYMVAYMYIRTQ